MKNVVQNDSRQFDYTNATGSDIASGEMVHLGGGMVGIAVDAIANGAKGVLIVSDLVATVPRVVGAAMTVGQVPGVGTAGNTVAVDTTALTTITNAVIWKASTTADTTVELALK